MAAHNWRTLRQKGLSEGVGDLMALPSMHVVLDLIETLGIESAVQGAKTDSEAQGALSQFYDKLYKPDIREAMLMNEPDPVPPGFEDDAVEAAFDAFASSLRGT